MSGIGHNQPPSTAIERALELTVNANKWVGERPEIENEEQAAAAQLFIDQLRACRDDLGAEQKTERKPHDEAIGEITKRYRDPLSLIGIALTRMQEKAGAWLSKKREQIARETAERQRAAEEAKERANQAITEAVSQPSIEADLAARRATEEAERAAKAATKAAPKAQVKGDFADKAMSLREFWHAEITDEARALRAYAKDPNVRRVCLAEALKQANALARREKRKDAAPPGFRFFTTEKAV
jgi:hypothetical protein